MQKQAEENPRARVAESAGGESSNTIDEFCRSERISRSFFYVMQKEGWGPRLMYVGTSVRISAQARRDWQREREAAAAAGMRRGTNIKKNLSTLGLPMMRERSDTGEREREEPVIAAASLTEKAPK